MSFTLRAVVYSVAPAHMHCTMLLFALLADAKLHHDAEHQYCTMTVKLYLSVCLFKYLWVTVSLQTQKIRPANLSWCFNNSKSRNLLLPMCFSLSVILLTTVIWQWLVFLFIKEQNIRTWIVLVITYTVYKYFFYKQLFSVHFYNVHHTDELLNYRNDRTYLNKYINVLQPAILSELWSYRNYVAKLCR